MNMARDAFTSDDLLRLFDAVGLPNSTHPDLVAAIERGCPHWEGPDVDKLLKSLKGGPAVLYAGWRADKGGGHAAWNVFEMDGERVSVTNCNRGFGASCVDERQTTTTCARTVVVDKDDLKRMLDALKILNEPGKVSEELAGSFYKSFESGRIPALSEFTLDELKAGQSNREVAYIKGRAIGLRGNSTVTSAQTVGNCAAASLEALVHFMAIAGGEGNHASAEEAELQRDTTCFYTALTALNMLINTLENAKPNDENYPKLVNIANAELIACIQRFDSFRHRINSVDVLHEYDARFAEIRKVLTNAFQQIPLDVHGLNPEDAAAIDLSQILPGPPAFESSPVQAPVLSESPLGNSLAAVDTALATLQDSSSDAFTRWKAIFDVVELFRGGELSFGSNVKNQLFANALKQMLLHDNVPLDKLSEYLEKFSAEDERVLQELLAALAKMCEFLSINTNVDIRRVSVGTQNAFLTVLGMYLGMFRDVVRRRQEAILQAIPYYIKVDPSIFSINVPLIRLDNDSCISEAELKRRRTLIKLFGTPPSEGGIELNSQGGDSEEKFVPLKAAFLSLANGSPGHDSFEEFEDNLRNILTATHNAEQSSKLIVDRLKQLKEAIQRSNEKATKLAALQGLQREAEAEKTRLTGAISGYREPIPGLKQQMRDAENKYKSAEATARTHRANVFDPALRAKTEAEKKLQDFQNDVAALKTLERDLERFLADAKSQKSEEGVLDGSLANAKREQDLAQKALDAAKAKLAADEAELADAKRRGKPSAKLGLDVANAQKQRDRDTISLNDAKNKVAELERQLNAARNNAKRLRDDITRTQNRINDIRNRYELTDSTSSVAGRREIENLKEKFEKAYNDCLQKFEAAGDTQDELDEKTAEAQQEWNGLQDDVHEIEEFVGALENELARLNRWINDITDAIAVVTGWDDPSSTATQENQKQVRHLLHDYLLLQERSLVGKTVQDVYLSRGAIDGEISLRTDSSGLSFTSVVDRLRSRSDAPYQRNVHSCVASQKRETDALCNTHYDDSRIREIATLGYDNTIMTHGRTSYRYQETCVAKFGQRTLERLATFDKLDLSQWQDPDDDLSPLQKAIDELARYIPRNQHQEMPPDATAALQRVYDDGQTECAKRDAEAAEAIVSVRADGNDVARNIARAIGVSSTHPGSIDTKLLQEDPNLYASRYMSHPTPRGAIGLGDLSSQIDTIDQMSALSYLSNSRLKLPPSEIDAEQTGAGLSSFYSRVSPSTALSKVTKLKFTPAFPESRQGSACCQDSTPQGKRAANEKLIGLSRLPNDFPTQLEKLFVNDHAHTASRLLNLLSALGNNAATLCVPNVDLNGVINGILPLFGVPTLEQSVVQGMTPDDVRRVLAELDALVAVLTRMLIRPDADNPIIDKYDAGVMRLLEAIGPVFGVIAEICAQTTLHDPACEKVVLEGICKVCGSLTKLYYANTSNTDPDVTEGNTAIARVVLQVSASGVHIAARSGGLLQQPELVANVLTSLMLCGNEIPVTRVPTQYSRVADLERDLRACEEVRNALDKAESGFVSAVTTVALGVRKEALNPPVIDPSEWREWSAQRTENPPSMAADFQASQHARAFHYDPGEQAIFDKDGALVFSFSAGVNADVSSSDGVKTVSFVKAFGSLGDEYRRRFMAFLGQSDNSPVRVYDDGNEKTYKLTDGPYAGMPIVLRRDTSAVDKSLLAQMGERVFCLFPEDKIGRLPKEGRCKILSSGDVWVTQTPDSVIYEIFNGQISNNGGQSLDAPNVMVTYSKNRDDFAVEYRCGDGSYHDACILKFGAAGVGIPALENVDVIFVDNNSVVVPNVIFNGQPLTFQKNGNKWGVVGIPNCHVATPEDQKRLMQGGDALTERYPLWRGAFITLCPDGEGTLIRHLDISKREDNSKIYNPNKPVPGTFLPAYSGGTLEAFDEDSRRFKPVKNSRGQIVLHEYIGGKDGDISPTGTVDSLHAVLQILVAVQTLLLRRQYEAATNLLKKLRLGISLPNGEGGDVVRRAFAEVCLSIRDTSPPAMAIKFAAIDMWQRLEANPWTIVEYCTGQLRDGKFMSFPPVADEGKPAPDECAIDSFLRFICKNISDPSFYGWLARKFGYSKESVCDTVKCIYSTFAECQLGSSATETIKKRVARLQTLLRNSWAQAVGSVKNELQPIPWPDSDERRKAALGKKDLQGLELPDAAKEIVAEISEIFSAVSTKFGYGANQEQQCVEFNANSDDPAIQAAYDRLRKEFEASTRCAAQSRNSVPADLRLSPAHYAFGEGVQNMRTKLARQAPIIEGLIGELIAGAHFEPINIFAAIRCLLLTVPTLDGDRYLVGPSHFCPQFVVSRESYEQLMGHCRTYALCAMFRRGCDDVDGLMKRLDSGSLSDVEKAATWEKLLQLVERIRGLCSFVPMGNVAEALGQYVHPDVLLSFGLYQGIIPSAEQVSILRDLMAKKYPVTKLMMGGGKSSVISALVGMAQASIPGDLEGESAVVGDEARLTVIAAHKSQFGNAAAFWRESQDKMGQKAMVINPTRLELQSPKYLRDLLAALEASRKEAGVVCLETGFFSKLELEIVEALSSFRRIAELYDAANAIALEVDVVFRTLQDAIASGQKVEPSVLTALNEILTEKIKELENIQKRIRALQDATDGEERFHALLALKKFFKEKGFVILDEVHLSANPKEEVNYPCGVRRSIPQDLNENYANLFKIMAEFNQTHPDYGQGGIFGLANNSQAQKTDADFERELDVFARYLFTCYTAPSCKVSDFLGRHHINPENFIAVMTGKLDAADVLHIQEIQASGDKTDCDMLKSIMTWLEVICQLRTCRKSEINRKAGLHQRPGEAVARMVPFVASMTPSPNDFACPQEQMTYYYMQAAIALGSYFFTLLPELVNAFVSSMSIPIAQETVNRDGGRENTDLFERVMGMHFGDVMAIIRHKDVKKDAYEKFMNDLCSRLEKDSVARLTLFEAYSPKSNNYNKSMQTDNCTTITSLFRGNTMGCTGTLSNSDVLPRELRDTTGVEAQAGIEGAIFSKLSKDLKAGTSKIGFIPSGQEPNVADLFQSVPKDKRSQVRLLVDRGGLFKVKSLHDILVQFGQELIDNNAGVEWIVCEDSGGNFIAYDIRGDGKNNKHLTGVTSADLRKAGLNPDECAAFFSERLATGTDAQFAANAYGIMTANPNTNTPEEWAQAIMRLRQYFTGQQICIAVAECPRTEGLKDLPTQEQLVQLLALLAQNEGENNKTLILQAALNELHYMFKSILVDAIANLSFSDAKLVLSAFCDFFVKNVDLDVISSCARRQSMVPGVEIIQRQARMYTSKFLDVLDKYQNCPAFAKIRGAFTALNAPKGELPLFLEDIGKRLKGFMYRSSAMGGSGGSTLEQQVETIVQKTVQFELENQQECSLNVQCTLTTTTTTFPSSNPRVKDELNLMEGVPSEYAIKVDASMFRGWRTQDEKYPNPGTLFSRLYLTKNLACLTEDSQIGWPFHELGGEFFIMVDPQHGKTFIVDGFEANRYIANANLWAPGKPVLFTPNGGVLVGNKDALPEHGEEIYEALLLLGRYSDIPVEWLRRFMDPAHPNEFTGPTVTAFVLLCETESDRRRQAGLLPLDEDEKAAIAKLFTKNGGTGSRKGTVSASMFPLSQLVPKTLEQPWNSSAVALFLSQRRDGLTEEVVQQMTGNVLNDLPVDLFVQICMEFLSHIDLAGLSPERLIMYDMICCITDKEYHPGLGECIEKAAVAFLAFSKQDFEGTSPLEALQTAADGRVEATLAVFCKQISDTVSEAVRLFGFWETDDINLSPSDRQCAQDMFQRTMAAIFRDNLSKDRMLNCSAGTLQEAVGNALLQANASVQQKCSPAQLAQIKQWVDVVIKQLFDQRYASFLEEIRGYDESFARVKASLTTARKVKAILAWVFVYLLAGFPLIFRSEDSEFDKLLKFPFRFEAQMEHIKMQIANLKNPDRATVLALCQQATARIPDPDPDPALPLNPGGNVDSTAQPNDSCVLKPDAQPGAVAVLPLKLDVGALASYYEDGRKAAGGSLDTYIAVVEKTHEAIESMLGTSASSAPEPVA
ncbi:MAG: hypothetical protein LBB26_03080 [Puniceicoccales bacterium]|nr:hypothetical protein [Puniceicoccales bacterium]